MDPKTGSLEAFIDHVRGLSVVSGLSVSEVGDAVGRFVAALGPDARSACLGVTGVGRELVEGAARLEATQHVKDLLNTGAVSFEEARRRLGYGEEDEVTRRRRRYQGEEVPAEAAPIMGYLRIHRDPMTLRTTISYKDGTVLLHVDETVDKRPLGQIIVEELVPRICSGCGGLLETSLCDPCRAEAIADLRDVLGG